MNRLVLFIILLIPAALTAQTKEPLIGKVYYLFKYMNDSARRDAFQEENMVLRLGNRSSLYLSLDRLKKDSLQLQQLNENGGLTVNTAGKKTSATQVYKDISGNKLFMVEKLIKNYVFEEAWPQIAWTISTETKLIEKLPCTKATGHFKGRDYIAWFTADVPAATGPWKLGGLPGLILEAEDTRGEVFFKFAGMEMTAPGSAVSYVTLPDNAVKTTKEDYFRLREVAMNDPVGFVNSAAAESGSGVRISSGGTGGPVKLPKPTNKMELSDH